MKKMNYLMLIGLLVFGSACTNYSPFGESGSEEESEVFYLELDFHQLALANEDNQLRLELVQIEEKLENGNEEYQNRIEEIQIRRAVIEETMAINAEFLNNRPRIGGGGLPPPCNPGLEFKACPMPRVALDNLWVFVEDSEKASGVLLDDDGRVVGELIDLEPLPETDGLFLKAIFEYDVRSASTLSFTKLDSRGALVTTNYTLE